MKTIEKDFDRQLREIKLELGNRDITKKSDYGFFQYRLDLATNAQRLGKE